MDLPRYDELPLLPGLDVRHAWDVFGEDDALGSVNLVTPKRVAAAAAEIRTGELFPLDLPLDLPDPPMFGRRAYRHHIGMLNRHEMDDHLDDFHPQASTQWDALSHVRAREHGFWGGRTTNPTDGPNELGIEHVARHGIAGRGILIDVASHLARHDPSYDPLTPYGITADHVRATLDAEQVTPEPGDIWCLRTGWIEAYRRLDRTAREALATEARSAGLVGDHEVTRLVWDAHPAALCADNPGVEMAPGDPAVGSLHRRLIPGLGMTLGEFFDLDRLAVACRADGRFTFFFVAAPLHLPGGIGSTGNAVAIR
jgi:hypothetical protein